MEIDIPAGWSVISANGWIDAGGGVLRLDVSALADTAGEGVPFVVGGPSLQAAPDDDNDVALTVRAIATQVPVDGEGTNTAANVNTASDTATIVVEAVAGIPTVSLAAAPIDEDSPLTPVLTVSFTEVADPDEVQSVEIDIPAGWTVVDANGWTDSGGGIYVRDVSDLADTAGAGNDFDVDGPILRPPLNDSTDLAALTVRAITVQTQLDGEGADTAPNSNTATANAAVTVNPVVDAVFTAGSDTIDLREAAGFFNSPGANNPFVEDGNFLDASGGADSVQLPDATDALFAAQYAGNFFLGGAGNDILTGGTGDDSIDAGDDDDTLNGGAGADTLNGGAGNDLIVYAAGDGDDTVDGGSEADVLHIDGANTAGTLALTGDGSATAQLDVDSNTISLIGIETLEFHGGGEADSFTVGGDLTATAVNDILFFGDAGADELDASGLEAPIGIAADGGAGNDILAGGAGADMLTGGADADRFRLNDLGSVDTIADFDPDGGDVLDLRDVLTGYTDGVDDINDFVLFDDDGVNTTVQIDTDGLGTGAGFSDAAILSGVTGRTLDDLIASNNVDIA